MPQDYSESAALKMAKEAVSRIESQYQDPNRIKGELVKMQANNSIGRIPTADDIFKQRVAELAHAYADVSNGRGGVDPASGKLALERFSSALEGKYSGGKGFLLSQQLAIQTGKIGQLTENVLGSLSKFGIGGKTVAGLAAITFTGLASAGEATASQLAEAGLNGFTPGLGTLVVGEGSTRNRLCQIFGDVVVPGAVGVGTGLIATPIAGLAAGAAASVALSQPATNSCNNTFQKLGM